MMSGHYSLDKKGISVWTDTLSFFKKKTQRPKKCNFKLNIIGSPYAAFNSSFKVHYGVCVGCINAVSLR